MRRQSCKLWVGGLSLIATLAAIVAVLAFPTLAAETQSAGPPPSTMEAAPGVAATFEEVSAPSGVEAVLKGQAHAAAWGDVNGDGYPDLYWGSWTNQGPNRLLINQRDGTLRESVQESVNRTDSRASGSVFADLDNDGDLDLVVINNWRTVATCGNQLLRNDGAGNFTDVSAGSGLELPQFSGRNPFVLDFDGDGLLDLIVQHDMWGSAGCKKTALLRNMGKLIFKDVTAQAGLPAGDSELNGLGGAVGDVNGDTWPDFLHVGSVRKGKLAPPDIRLYVNNRDGTFRLAKTFDFGATFPLFGNGEDWVCGAAFGDLNGDGRIDAVIGLHYGSSALPEGPKRKAVSVRAYLNLGNDEKGDPRWQDVTAAGGLKELFVKQPHVDIQDFNNDGRMDIWNSVTMPRLADGQATPYVQYNLGNGADGIPRFAPPPGLGIPPVVESPTGDKRRPGLRYAAYSPTADYDLDGRLDIFMGSSRLFRNTTGDMGPYLDVKVDLGAAAPNRFGVGAKVSVYTAGRAGDGGALLGVGLIEIGNGYCSGRPATAHFGVPGHRQVDVVVQMPCGGPVLKAPGVKTNQLLTVSR